MPKKYLTVKDASSQLIREKEIRATKLNQSRILSTDLEDFMLTGANR